MYLANRIVPKRQILAIKISVGSFALEVSLTKKTTHSHNIQALTSPNNYTPLRNSYNYKVYRLYHIKNKKDSVFHSKPDIFLKVLF